MTPRLTALLKSILYPSIVLAAHHLVENWPTLVAMLGPKYAWLGGPLVVGIGVVILHQMDPPGSTPPAGGNS